MSSRSPERGPSITRRSMLGGLAGVGISLTAAGCFDEGAATFLALGDSYTVGTNVEPADRWADRLPDRLRDRGIDLAAPEIVAESGWTTLALATELDRRQGRIESADDPELLADQYDLVTLCIGANDAFNERLLESFVPDFVGLLDRAIGLAGDRPGRVLAMTIPDYTATPLGQRQLSEADRERLGQYNARIVEESRARNTRLVDLVPPSRRVREDPDLVTGDDLHPSAKQYDLWLDRIEPTVAEMLEE